MRIAILGDGHGAHASAADLAELVALSAPAPGRSHPTAKRPAKWRSSRARFAEPPMPLISSFYGVLVYLYWPDTRQHHLPHIHAIYAGDEAVFGIESAEILDGSLPRRQTRLVQAWIELHRDERMADWSLAVKGEPVFPIDPLK